mgnify:CR=1 FL=1
MARQSRPRRQSMVPREVLTSIDDVERRIVFGGAGLGLALTLLFLAIPPKGYIYTHPKHKVCPPGYDHYKDLCQHITTLSFSGYAPQFAATALGAIVLAYAGWKRKRTLAAFTAMIAGLMLGNSGIYGLPGMAMLFLGGWLMMRAWRLQKYGAAGFMEVNKISQERARERAAERRAARGTGRRSSDAGATDTRRVDANKRYTPKKNRPVRK